MAKATDLIELEITLTKRVHDSGFVFSKRLQLSVRTVDGREVWTLDTFEKPTAKNRAGMLSAEETLALAYAGVLVANATTVRFTGDWKTLVAKDKAFWAPPRVK